MKKNKYIRNCIIALVSLCMIIVGIRAVYIDNRKLDLSVGNKMLKVLDDKKVSDVENKIAERDEKELEQQEEQERRRNRTPNEKMNYAVVMGDSRTEPLLGYQIIDGSKVIAKIGIQLHQLDEHIEEAIERKPQYIFLAYGLNDISNTKGDYATFKKRYQNVIRRLKIGLPNAKIYVNTILDVQQKAIDRSNEYKDIDNYNKVILELSQEEHIGFIDISDLKQDDLFEPDGEHLKPSFYSLWIDKMAEAAGI